MEFTTFRVQPGGHVGIPGKVMRVAGSEQAAESLGSMLLCINSTDQRGRPMLEDSRAHGSLATSSDLSNDNWS